MFRPSAPPTTVFEVAPNSAGGETFWIYEIDEPGIYFEECGNEQDALEKLIESDRGPDEQIETCGYTLVLDSPEDPPSDNSVDAPEKPIVVEVLKGNGKDQIYEFYEIEDPVDTFGDSWGDTTEMFEAIRDAGISPVLEYENVSLKFQRPYGAL